LLGPLVVAADATVAAVKGGVVTEVNTGPAVDAMT
jgi:hypothetical protein